MGADWSKFRTQGREEAAAQDGARVIALVEVAKSLRRSGFTRLAAEAQILLIVGTSTSRSEREYIAGVVEFAYETA